MPWYERASSLRLLALLTHLPEALDAAERGGDEEVQLRDEGAPRFHLVALDARGELTEEHPDREDQELLVVELAAVPREPRPCGHLEDDHRPKCHVVSYR